jgi:CheY-like chemotaxis protein/HPt (histidine-containing phosphotransfer) domain-containing protein
MTDDILQDYFVETEERLERLTDELLKVEAGAADMSVIKREFHTFKGLSAAFGFADLSGLCHLIEDHIKNAEDNDCAVNLQAILDACDFIGAHASAVQAGNIPPEISEAIRADLSDDFGTTPLAPSPPPAPSFDDVQTASLNGDPIDAIVSERDATASGEPMDARFVASAALAEPPPRSERAHVAALQAQPTAAAPAHAPKRRYLIVDDEPANCELLVDIMTEFGDCVLARDGRECVDIFTQALADANPFAAICLDIWMPRLDGHSTLEQIRCLEHQHKMFGSAGVKILMITAEHREDHLSRAFRTGCQSYVNKPVVPTQIRRELARLGVLGDCTHSKRRLSFVDDVREVGIHIGEHRYQLGEVIDESRTDIRVLVHDVTRLRPETEVLIDYRQSPMKAVAYAVQPMSEDSRFSVEFRWV